MGNAWAKQANTNKKSLFRVSLFFCNILDVAQKLLALPTAVQNARKIMQLSMLHKDETLSITIKIYHLNRILFTTP